MKEVKIHRLYNFDAVKIKDWVFANKDGVLYTSYHSEPTRLMYERSDLKLYLEYGAPDFLIDIRKRKVFIDLLTIPDYDLIIEKLKCHCGDGNLFERLVPSAPFVIFHDERNPNVVFEFTKEFEYLSTDGTLKKAPMVIASAMAYRYDTGDILAIRLYPEEDLWAVRKVKPYYQYTPSFLITSPSEIWEMYQREEIDKISWRR